MSMYLEAEPDNVYLDAIFLTHVHLDYGEKTC